MYLCILCNYFLCSFTCILSIWGTARCLGYVDICLLKLSDANVNLSIAIRLCLNARTVFRQISADQETAISLFLNVTQYSIWIHKNSVGVPLNTAKDLKLMC